MEEREPGKTCCVHRQKIVLGIIAVLPESACGVKDSELADLLTFDTTGTGTPILRTRFCAWCGAERSPDDEDRITEIHAGIVARDGECDHDDDPLGPRCLVLVQPVIDGKRDMTEAGQLVDLTHRVSGWVRENLLKIEDHSSEATELVEGLHEIEGEVTVYCAEAMRAYVEDVEYHEGPVEEDDESEEDE